MKSLLLTFFLCALSSISLASSQRFGWHLSTFMGVSRSLDNRVSFHLNDQADQVFGANYINRSFEDSHWWSFRLEKWSGNRLKGLELIHHKIYLDNTNDIIEIFSISDGYNLLYYNIGAQKGNTIYRIGFGVVLAHSDVKIAGRDRYKRKGFSGHKLAGPSIQLNMERWLWESQTHFISFDAKASFSYAVAPISENPEEYVVAPDIACHFSFGFGSKPAAFKQKGFKKWLFFAPLAYPKIVGEGILGTGILPEDYNL